MTKKHQPVMLEQTIAGLEIKPGEWYIDATFGRGGHTKAILEKGGNVVAFDWDSEAIVYGKKVFEKEINEKQLILIHSTFASLKNEFEKIQDKHKIVRIKGILLDFGTTSDQLTSGERGFSFHEDGELDMRMDTRLGVLAKDLLALLSEKQLAQLFREFGGEHHANAIARAIKNAKQPITTTKQLADLVERVKRGPRGHLHPATKVFQALRIAVNSELDEIEAALPQALEIVAPGGVIATISFHEGEDRLAKVAFKDWTTEGKGTLLHKKPLEADASELERNPNSRSAKLRFFRKN